MGNMMRGKKTAKPAAGRAVAKKKPTKMRGGGKAKMMRGGQAKMMRGGKVKK